MIFYNIRILRRFRLNHQEHKAILSAALVSMLEFYDFIIFGFMVINLARNIFQHQLILTLSVGSMFAIFMLGYTLRLLGMYLYSKVAARYSPNWIMSIITLLLILAASTLALVPLSANIAIPLTIISLARLIQGLAGGADMQAANNHLARYLAHKSGIAVFGILAGAELGQLLGVFSNRLLSSMFSHAQMELFGWRLAFLSCALLALLVQLLRYCLRTKSLSVLQSVNPPRRRQIIPSYKLFSYYPHQTTIALILSGMKGCTTFVFLIFIPFGLYYTLKLDYATIAKVIFMASLISIAASAVLNYYLTFNNARRIMGYCILLLAPSILFWTWAFSHHRLMLLSILPLAILANFFSLLVPRLTLGLFPAPMRLAGVTFSYHYGFIVFGGVAPLVNGILAYIIHHYLNPNLNPSLVFYWCSAAYILVISALSLLALAKLNNYANYQELNAISRKLRQKRHARYQQPTQR